MDGFIEEYYTGNMYPERLKPIPREELVKHLDTGVVDKYLSIVKQLFTLCSYDVNAAFSRKSFKQLQDEDAQFDAVYRELVNLMFKKDMITDSTYLELQQGMPIGFDFLERPDRHGKYVSDTCDDYRLAFERSIVDCCSSCDITCEYLHSRYGYRYCGRPNSLEKEFITNKDLFLFNCVDALDHPIQEIGYWEAYSLLKKIRQDQSHNRDEQRQLDTHFCQLSQSGHSNYITSLGMTYQLPRTIHEWYTIKRALLAEAKKLRMVEKTVSEIFDGMKKPESMVGSGAALYIYKGKTFCHQHHHSLISATAIVSDDQGNDIDLDVEYCSSCERYMLNYTSFSHYREQYGILIGKLKMLSTGNNGNDIELAQESPLKLCGYNVSQAEGSPSATRQYILSKIIYDGIMKKIEVIHYLEHFITMNGSKPENALALQKWHEDLQFVHEYDIATQPQVFVSSIKRY